MEFSNNINHDVLSLVNKVVKQRGYKHDDLGRRIGLSYSGTHKMLTSKALTVSRLKDLSIALQYNFFASLATQFALAEPNTKGKREQELEQRIYDLELENRTLFKILKDEK